jgi:hypothetical protein
VGEDFKLFMALPGTHRTAVQTTLVKFVKMSVMGEEERILESPKKIGFPNDF